MTKLVHRTNIACPSHEASTLASSRHRDCRWVALRSHARHRRLQPSPVHTLACAHRTLQDPCARHGSRTLSKAHSCSSTRLLTILRLRSDEPNYLTAHGTNVPMWVARLGLRSQISGIIGESVRRTVNAVRLPPNRSRPLALREEHKQGKALGGDRHSPSRPPPTQNAPTHTLPIIRSGPTNEEELPAPNPPCGSSGAWQEVVYADATCDVAKSRSALTNASWTCRACGGRLFRPNPQSER